jgi:hypothetical protein
MYLSTSLDFPISHKALDPPSATCTNFWSAWLFTPISVDFSSNRLSVANKNIKYRIMQYRNLTVLSSLLSLATAAPKGFISKRDDQKITTWGPLIGLGPSANGIEITSVVATLYPGNTPKMQTGGLYNWIGINNETETGDLVQGIVGSYAPGESECKGVEVDSQWYVIFNQILNMVDDDAD